MKRYSGSKPRCLTRALAYVARPARDRARAGRHGHRRRLDNHHVDDAPMTCFLFAAGFAIMPLAVGGM